MKDRDDSLLPGKRSPAEEPKSDSGRRLALGLTAGAGLIAVAVVAGVLVVAGGIAFVRWFIEFNS